MNCTFRGMKPKSQVRKRNLDNIAVAPVPARSTRQRLADSFACLESIQLMRDRTDDPLFGRRAEDEIVWRELVELQLQEVDEQIERIATHSGSESD